MKSTKHIADQAKLEGSENNASGSVSRVQLIEVQKCGTRVYGALFETEARRFAKKFAAWRFDTCGRNWFEIYIN